MAIFGGKRKEAIPPFTQPGASSSSRSSYTSAPLSRPDYNTRPDGSFDRDASVSPATSRYGTSSYGGANTRNELLGGTSSRPSLPAPTAQHGQESSVNDDEEVEGIKQSLRFVKQESLASTRNAARIAREAEETAMATLNRLGDQSNRLSNARQHVDMAAASGDRANDEITEIKALNRSIFRPNFTMNRQAQRDKEQARLLARHTAEQATIADTRAAQMESRSKMLEAQSAVGRMAGHRGATGMRMTTERSRYQFEATESDEEVEDEIDSNLDDIGSSVARLRAIAVASGEEVSRSNQQIVAISRRVDEVDVKVVGTTSRMARIK